MNPKEKKSTPVSFQVMIKPIGSVCNLDCQYCYYLEKQNLYPDQKHTRISEELLESFTRQYIEANDVSPVVFTWQGGEPALMGLDFFRRALEIQKKYAGNKKIDNIIQTNGTTLNDDWCSFFSDNNFLVGISIDGPEHNHDYYRKTKKGGKTFKQVMRGIEYLHKHKVEFNTLSCVNQYNVRFPLETYHFLKQTGSGFMQFIPIVERIALNPQPGGMNMVTPDFDEPARLAEWSVQAKDFGKFLVEIFDEWVRNDVGKYFIQLFDTTLANWVGEMPGVCIFGETCGDGLVMEHNGDLFACDHYVYPEYLLGNLRENTLTELAGSDQQLEFGLAKRTGLPRYCQDCDVRFACHGECPKNRIIRTPDGESGLNHLCQGYKMFFHHVKPYMDYMAMEHSMGRPAANVSNWIRNLENKGNISSKPGRNDPCPCGSGKKYKQCCAL